MRPDVIEDVKLCGIKIDTRLLVANEGVVRPAIPQTGNDVDELTRPAIALGVLEMFVEAEIHGLVRIAGSHDVPGGTATAQVIQRRKLPRNMKRLVIRRRGRRDQPQMLRDNGQRR